MSPRNDYRYDADVVRRRIIRCARVLTAHEAGATLQNIAFHLGVSRERIRQLRSRAVRDKKRPWRTADDNLVRDMIQDYYEASGRERFRHDRDDKKWPYG